MSTESETVYAHVERTVHALLGVISTCPLTDAGAARVKLLAEAVAALAAWRPPAWPTGYSLEASR